LIVAHVLTPVMPLMPDGYMSAKAYHEIEAAARHRGQTQLDGLVAKAKRAGVRARALLLYGVAVDRILRAARSRRADMIVIGTHGRTGFARFVLGSVASGVVTHARCPVLTVRGR
jgi:nucleotide-binding universal stress UspA family protein